MEPNWSPSSWQSKKILQQPEYSNKAALDEVLAKVHALPPIVHFQEVDALKRELAKAGRGETFLLQVRCSLGLRTKWTQTPLC